MKTEANHQTYLTRKQVQVRYQVSHDTVHEWVRSKRLPAPYRLGERAVRWKLSELEAFEQGCSNA